jgi:uncharacterized protein (DUF1684 family)
MTITSRNLLLGVIAFLLAACGTDEPPLDIAAHEAEIMEWREGRLAGLMDPDGYLTLVGLYWLEGDDVRIGSAADNDLQFPANAAEHIGVVRVTESGLTLTVEPGVDVRNELLMARWPGWPLSVTVITQFAYEITRILRSNHFKRSNIFPSIQICGSPVRCARLMSPGS